MIIKLTSENYEKVISENPIVLIDFFATWCGPCKMLAPVIEELAEEKMENVAICKVDVDEESELAGKYGIQSIPTIIVVKDGKAVRQAMGYRPKESLINMLKF